MLLTSTGWWKALMCFHCQGCCFASFKKSSDFLLHGEYRVGPVFLCLQILYKQHKLKQKLRSEA